MVYRRLGILPPKRHTQFRRADGGLHYEEVFGSRGFSGPYSTLYHLRPPTAVISMARLESPPLQAWGLAEHRQHHLRTRAAPAGGDVFLGRQPLLYNDDVIISVSRPTEAGSFCRHGEADELYFVHEGSGRLVSLFGVLDYKKGDYLVVPRGTTYRLEPDEGASRFLIVEGYGAIETPARYRNEYGQLLEHAPFAQRDIRVPERLEAQDKAGEFEVRVKLRSGVMSYRYGSHPFDVVGWDGYLYPWAVNVGDLEPITGRVHQPPPAHQTFQGPNFVVCTFVPRKLDYHPLAVPAPYAHSNVDSDEVLYYARGRFTSRPTVEEASLTLHRRGLPHGPQPGAMEASLGRTDTDELAVMIDTFRPLHLASFAERYDDPGYPYSWVG